MKKKLKVGVVMGGPSSEREISLVTGVAILKNLDKKKYQASCVEMDTNAAFWLVANNGKRKLLDFARKDRKRFDLIFIAMHGTPGEDGTVQAMLEAWKIPYTGSQVLASALAMNKVYAAQIYIANGLPTPQFIHFKKDGWKERRDTIIKDVNEKIGFPAVVKPADQGSSVGVAIIKSQDELEKAVDKLIKLFPWLIIQKFVKGEETTCGVLEKNGEIFALPPTHIVANLGAFYDFKSKYKTGGSTHICPADFSSEIVKKIQILALQAHIVLGCSGMSRTDIFVADDDKLYIIETNTIPGMTPMSLFPEAAGKAGIDFGTMLDLIIKSAV